jgi:long-chain acyl-CoA synthetase
MTKIIESFLKNSRETPEKAAVYCNGELMTYQQLTAFVNRWSRALISAGVKRGDSIGVLLPNNIEFVALILVAAELGVVLVPLNTFLPAPAIHRAFEAADVKHVVAKSGILKSLRSSESHDFSFVNGLWLSIDNDIPGIENLENLLKKITPGYEPVSGAQDEDPLILTMTSGSTGDPKPIVLKQITKYNRVLAAVELYNITASDRILAATPLYHSLAERLVLIPLIMGGTSILMPRYSTSEWLRYVSEQSVSFTIAVSSQLRNIAQKLNSDDNADKISSLRCVVSSSERLDPRIKGDLISKLHCQFHECYGTSEIAIATNLDNESGLTKLNSVGKPAPGVEIIILRDNGEIAIPGESGEIVCKTPMIFGGYFKRPDLTQNSMWGDYFRTGDIGKLDSDGYLYFLGRSKDIIITGGINVYPQDIEVVISEHPTVLECAAFALPDENLGEIIAVAIVPKEQNDFDKRKIRHLCAERLADFQQPREYFLLKELPKNGVGKVMKNSLSAICSKKT